MPGFRQATALSTCAISRFVWRVCPGDWGPVRGGVVDWLLALGEPPYSLLAVLASYRLYILVSSYWLNIRGPYWLLITKQPNCLARFARTPPTPKLSRSLRSHPPPSQPNKSSCSLRSHPPNPQIFLLASLAHPPTPNSLARTVPLNPKLSFSLRTHPCDTRIFLLVLIAPGYTYSPNHPNYPAHYSHYTPTPKFSCSHTCTHLTPQITSLPTLESSCLYC